MTFEAALLLRPIAEIARTVGLGVLACVRGLVPRQADAQRAAEFHQRVQQYVVHDAPTIRIDDVRVIDGTGAPVSVGQSILMRDGKIVRMGPVGSMAREGADVVIDGKGRTVLPGLVMMHED